MALYKVIIKQSNNGFDNWIETGSIFVEIDDTVTWEELIIWLANLDKDGDAHIRDRAQQTNVSAVCKGLEFSTMMQITKVLDRPWYCFISHGVPKGMVSMLIGVIWATENPVAGE